jgi:hypothetical protein
VGEQVDPMAHSLNSLFRPSKQETGRSGIRTIPIAGTIFGYFVDFSGIGPGKPRRENEKSTLNVSFIDREKDITENRERERNGYKSGKRKRGKREKI